MWNISSFGVIPILGFLGFIHLSRERLFLGALTAIGLAVSNLLEYQFTWDIVKFATVASIALAMASGVALAQFWERARSPVQKLGFGIVVAAFALQGGAYPILAPVLYSVHQQIITPYFSLSFPLAPDEARAIAYLRTHMGPFDMVYRNDSKFRPYAVFAGLPHPGNYFPAQNGANDQYGLGEKKLLKRIDLNRISEDWVARLSAEHIRWIVSDSEETEINIVLEGAERNRTVFTMAQFGNLRISQISNASNPGGAMPSSQNVELP